jgi:hypothetical protein
VAAHSRLHAEGRYKTPDLKGRTLDAGELEVQLSPQSQADRRHRPHPRAALWAQRNGLV